MFIHSEIMLPLLLGPTSYDIAGLLYATSYDYANYSIYEIGTLFPAVVPSAQSLTLILDALNLPYPFLSLLNLQEACFQRHLYHDRSVIYIWLNTINGKCYVGSGKVYQKRVYEHLNAPAHSNKALQRALRKYGIGVFILIVGFDIGLFDTVDYEDLLAMEQAYLDSVPLHLKYNFNQIAGSTAGTTHIVSPDTRMKIADGLLAAGRTKPVIFTDTKGIELYSQSHRAAAKFVGVARGTIEKHINKNTTFSSPLYGVLTVRHG